jgi:hypothetical protein
MHGSLPARPKNIFYWKMMEASGQAETLPAQLDVHE